MTAPFQLLPPLTDEERTALRDDIAEHGVQQPIVVDEHGSIIDGHHRQEIADELGMACPRSVYPGYSDDQKRSLALRLNLHRRHLSREQRNELIVTLRKHGMTQQQIADETGVPQRTVSDVLNSESANEALPDTIVNSRGQERPTRYDRQQVPQPIDPDDPDLADDDIANPFRDAEPLDGYEDDEPESRPEWRATKPDLGDGISHPARYSSELIPLFSELLRSYMPGARVLDPFAGSGRIHELHPEFDTVGIEIEKEWADLHERTQQGSALDLPFDPATFDAIVTSPTYGNRLADSHNASDPERRRSYTHDLGHDLHEDNSGALHWRTSKPGHGAMGSFDYRNFHEKAWDEAVLVLRPGGLFILNCCDHIRDDLVQPVTAWHCWMLGRLGLEWVESRSVPTRKLRQGANGNLREQEQVHVFRKLT